MLSLPDIYATALRASIEASRAIMSVYAGEVQPDFKDDGSPVTVADLTASKIISKHLKSTNIPITGEELLDMAFSTRKTWKENWCVDPLDGTKMFLLKNGEFCVNIAHIVQGLPVFGIIANPVKEEVLIGGKTTGAFIVPFKDFENPSNWRVLSIPTQPNHPLVIACSRSFRNIKIPILEDLERKYGSINYLKKGSALKFFNLAEGSADMYLRFGPTMEWDIAAGQAILEALGGEVVDLESELPLTYNKESLFNPPFLAKIKPVIEP